MSACAVCGRDDGGHNCQFPGCMRSCDTLKDMAAHLERNFMTCGSELGNAAADLGHVRMCAVDAGNRGRGVARRTRFSCELCGIDVINTEEAYRRHFATRHGSGSGVIRDMEWCDVCQTDVLAHGHHLQRHLQGHAMNAVRVVVDRRRENVIKRRRTAGSNVVSLVRSNAISSLAGEDDGESGSSDNDDNGARAPIEAAGIDGGQNDGAIGDDGGFGFGGGGDDQSQDNRAAPLSPIVANAIEDGPGAFHALLQGPVIVPPVVAAIPVAQVQPPQAGVPAGFFVEAGQDDENDDDSDDHNDDDNNDNDVNDRPVGVGGDGVMRAFPPPAPADQVVRESVLTVNVDALLATSSLPPDTQLRTAIVMQTAVHLSRENRETLWANLSSGLFGGGGGALSIASTEYKACQVISSLAVSPRADCIVVPGIGGGQRDVHYIRPLEALAGLVYDRLVNGQLLREGSGPECNVAAANLAALRAVAPPQLLGAAVGEPNIDALRARATPKSEFESANYARLRERFALFAQQGFVITAVSVYADEAFAYRKKSLNFVRIRYSIGNEDEWLSLACIDNSQTDVHAMLDTLLGDFLSQLAKGITFNLPNLAPVHIVGAVTMFIGDKVWFQEMLDLRRNRAIHCCAAPNSALWHTRPTDAGGWRDIARAARMLTAIAARGAAADAAAYEALGHNVQRGGGNVRLPILFRPLFEWTVAAGSIACTPGDVLHQLSIGLVDHFLKRVAYSLENESCMIINVLLKQLPPVPIGSLYDSPHDPPLYKFIQNPKRGPYYGKATATMSGSQRLAKLVALPPILAAIGAMKAATAASALVEYVLCSMASGTSVGDRIDRLNDFRNAVEEAHTFWKLPDAAKWDEFRRNGASVATRKRLVLQWWAMPKFVDERFVFGVLASGPTRITSSQIPERLHQRDKDSSVNHSAMRDELVGAAVLNRSTALVAVNRAVRIAQLRAGVEAVPFAPVRSSLDPDSIHELSGVHALRGDKLVEARAALQDSVRAIPGAPVLAAVYGALRVVDAHKRGGGLIQFSQSPRFVGVDLYDADAGDDLSDVAAGHFGRIVAVFDTRRHNLTESWIVLDTMVCVVRNQLAGDEAARFDAARLSPCVAEGTWKVLSLVGVRRVDEMLVTGVWAGNQAAEYTAPVVIEQFAHTPAGRRYVWHTLWS